MKIPQPIARAALLPLPLLLLASCNRPPSSDGDDLADRGEEQAEGEDPGAMPDLPCGGADLLTDDFNCGACGNECDVMWSGTQYEAGGCVDGKCGPMWSGIFTLAPPPDSLTCEQMCAFGDRACVPQGCSGLTGFVCVDIGDFGNQCNLGDPLNAAHFEMAGECDAIPPYPNNVEPGNFVNLGCCCERP